MLQGSVNITYAALCKRWRQRRLCLASTDVTADIFPPYYYIWKIGMFTKEVAEQANKVM